MNDKVYDVAIIGSGLIGLSTAMALLNRYPGLKVVVLEKDNTLSSQQSGHNSGVIHSGIYYKPGSLKANFCVEGRAAMTRFCEENEIPVWVCGKLIVATMETELARLDILYERGKHNRVEGLELVGRERIKEIEPHVSAIKALWAPKTGIVDFRKVAQRYAEKILERDGTIIFDFTVNGITRRSDEIILTSKLNEMKARNIINCAGLHSDIVAKMTGMPLELRIIPFRGEYYSLRKDKEHLVKGLIYPAPDPALPFLGVHFTQTMKGFVEAGPNAVLAFKREGYRKRDISLNDFKQTLSYIGFWRLALRNWKTGIWEINRSLRKDAFVKSLQRLIPEVTSPDLEIGATGVRAQAVAPDGSLIDDFRIEESMGAVHVLNAPSPGATSSLVIGEYIANIAGRNFSLDR